MVSECSFALVLCNASKLMDHRRDIRTLGVKIALKLN